jgi:hypothetical protein
VGVAVGALVLDQVLGSTAEVVVGVVRVDREQLVELYSQVFESPALPFVDQDGARRVRAERQ